MNDTDSAEALERLVDIPVEVTVELGRKKVTVEQLLSLKSGSILELAKVSGDPLDVVVGQRLIARGEAVVIGDRYGIRITEVIVDTKSQTSRKLDGEEV
ncbi:MAG: flagellar motor switch protein FliN [Deltaproteobacteria bacterium]|nr:flagellar motor switch protein FliN [Deltaproteobacteria bacterium]